MKNFSKRSEEIDLLRALAIILVIIHHLGRGLLKGVLPPFLIEGWTGVDLFFVISGYLVTQSFASWLQHVGSDVAFKIRAQLALRFCMRRFVRILPPAWLWAFIPLVGSLYWNQSNGFGQTRELLSEFFAVLRLHYNYFAVSTGMGNMSQFWSLAVEEHFYLFLPVFFLIIPNQKYRFTGLFTIMLICWFNRIISWKSGTSFGEISFLTHFRLDGLALGSILGLFATSLRAWSKVVEKQSWIRLVLRAMVLIAIAYLWTAPSLMNRSGIVAYGYLSFALVSAFLVVTASLGTRIILCPNLVRPLITAIGRRSYTLYLLHLPILIALREMRFRCFGLAPIDSWHNCSPVAIEFIIFIVALFVLTELNFQLIESPLVELAKIRFNPFEPVFNSNLLSTKEHVSS